MSYKVKAQVTPATSGQLVYSLRIPNKVLAELLTGENRYELGLQFDDTASGSTRVQSGNIVDLSNGRACLCQIKGLSTDAKEVYRINKTLNSASSSTTSMQLLESNASKLSVVTGSGRKRSSEDPCSIMLPAVPPIKRSTVAVININSLSTGSAALETMGGNQNAIAVNVAPAQKKQRVRKVVAPTTPACPTKDVPSFSLSGSFVARALEGINWIAVKGVHPDVGLGNLSRLFAGLKFDETKIICTIDHCAAGTHSQSEKESVCESRSRSSISANAIVQPIMLNFYLPFTSFADLSVALSRREEVHRLSPAHFSSESRSSRARVPGSIFDIYTDCTTDTCLYQVSLEELFWLEHVGLSWSALSTVIADYVDLTAKGISTARVKSKSQTDILTSFSVKLSTLHSYLEGTNVSAVHASEYQLSRLVIKYSAFLKSIQSKAGNRFVIGGAPGSMLRPAMLLDLSINGENLDSSSGFYSDLVANSSVVGDDSSGYDGSTCIRIELARFIHRLEVYRHHILSESLQVGSVDDECAASDRVNDEDMMVLDYCSRLLLCYRFMYNQYYKYH